MLDFEICINWRRKKLFLHTGHKH